jgi:hypothetical protein
MADKSFLRSYLCSMRSTNDEYCSCTKYASHWQRIILQNHFTDIIETPLHYFSFIEASSEVLSRKTVFSQIYSSIDEHIAAQFAQEQYSSFVERIEQTYDLGKLLSAILLFHELFFVFLVLNAAPCT